MAYNSANLSISISGMSTQTHMLDYTTTDDLATVEGSNYFSDAKPFRFYDLIRITANDGKAVYDIVSTDPVSLRKLAVASSFPSF